jgi:hypothetical protein
MEIANANIVTKDGSQKKDEPKRPKMKKGVLIFIVGFLLGALLVVGFVYYRAPQVFSLRTPEEQARLDVLATVKEVGKLMILPTNEEPTVLDITDPQSLIAQQPFFTGSIAGDKLLVYKTTARAIVYSPSRNLIVNVGPVTNNQPAVPSTPPVVQKKK